MKKPKTDQTNKKFFFYKDKLYPFDIEAFNAHSNYFIHNQNEITNLCTNLVNEYDGDISISDNSITYFVNYLHNNYYLITNENAFSLNYLAKKYNIPKLINETNDFISINHEELVIQFLNTNKIVPSLNTKYYEEIISDHFEIYITHDEILEFPVPTLYRMLAKYKLKKSKIEIKDFLFKCLDKYGKGASILFEGIDLENEPEYIRKLISEPYRKKFDFNLIEPSCDFSSYELRNSIIMNRQAIQIHQMDILSQFSAEIDTLKNAMTCELKKMSDKFEEEKIEMRNNFQVQIDNIAKESNKKQEDLENQIFQLKNSFFEVYSSQFNDTNDSIEKFNGLSGEAQTLVLPNIARKNENEMIFHIIEFLSFISNENRKIGYKYNQTKYIQICSKDDKQSLSKLKKIEGVEIQSEEIEILFETDSLKSFEFFEKVNFFENVSIDLKYQPKKNSNFKNIYDSILHIIRKKSPNFKLKITILGFTQTDNFLRGCEMNSVVIWPSTKEISEGSFEKCAFLSEVQMPDSITSIRKDAFNSCSNLNQIKISSNVELIEEKSFENCVSLKSIEIPQSVKMIKNMCFNNCVNLNEITINPYTTKIELKTFNNCPSLHHLIFPPTCVSILQYEFDKYFSNITKITIPDSVTSIEKKAFTNLTSLTEITIPMSVSHLGNYSFGSCKKLKKINIPSSVKWIGKYCFSRCESLIEVTLSSSLEKIGKFSFFQCTSLPEILIPSSVTEIGEGSFHECSSLKKVSILSHISIIEEKTFFGCSLLEKILISSSVKEIGQNSFGECTSLTEINIPPSVTIIRMNAFINCSSLILVSINSNLTVIEKSAFEMCSSLREITIPPSVTQVSERCFYGCKKLEKITMDPFKTKVCDDSFENCQSFCHLIINSNARIINQINSVVIKLAKRITIPDSVVKIESKSFSNCANLEYILFSKDSSLKIIEDYAFSNCYSLIKFKFPSSVSFIGNYAFNSCSSLTEIKIPSFVTSIQDYTFCNCKQLNSVSIYFPMSSIGKHAFDGCSSLKNIKLPNSLTLIDESAFENCNSLTAITIPVSVKNIKSSAFCKCLALTKAIIPSSVSLIGENCFKDCKKLLNIEIDIYHTKIEKNSFENETKIILKDGIFNYLRSVSNIDNEVSITSTTVGGGNPKTLIEYHDDLSKLFYTDNVKDAWICFKFENYCIIPTSYTIRSYCNKKDWMHPRNWILEGITIDNEIITLDTRKNCPFLNGPNLVHNFVIDRKVCTPFKCLKISNTCLNWSENYFFSFDTIEFFGRLI